MEQKLQEIPSHLSCRSFDINRPVSTDFIKALIEKAQQQASTSCNFQMYRIVTITDKELRKKMVKLCQEQPYIQEAPVFLVFLADTRRMIKISERFGEKYGPNDLSLTSIIDATILSQALMAAAEQCGLRGVYIGGVREKLHDVQTAIGIESKEERRNLFPVFGMCLGFAAPTEKGYKPPRLSSDTVLCENSLHNMVQTDEELVAGSFADQCKEWLPQIYFPSGEDQIKQFFNK